MKKNTTTSKASLKHLAREQPIVARHPRKVEPSSVQHKPKRAANNFVGFGDGQGSAELSTLVRCGNCDVLVQRELMKLHSNVCPTGHKATPSTTHHEVETCKSCFKKIPLHLLMSHVSSCAVQSREEEIPRGPNKYKHNEYSEMPREVIKQPRHTKDKPDSHRKHIEQERCQRQPARRNNPNTRKQQLREIIEVAERPNSRQKEILMRARTNDMQQKMRQKEREQERLRQEQLEKERREKQKERERQRIRDRQRERERERVSQQQQRQQNIQQEPQVNQARRRARHAGRSNNSRRPRRQNSMPGVGMSFFPMDIFHRIQSGFQELRINSTSFQQQMENLSSHFGYVLQNFSNLMVSPLGNQRRRVIWYEEDIYTDMSDASAGEYSGEDGGLHPEQIDEIPVHQFNSRRTHVHTDTTSKSCAVCLSDFTHGQSIKALYCYHKFHQECIDRWLQIKGTCPVCREDLRG